MSMRAIAGQVQEAVPLRPASRRRRPHHALGMPIIVLVVSLTLAACATGPTAPGPTGSADLGAQPTDTGGTGVTPPNLDRCLQHRKPYVDLHGCSMRYGMMYAVPLVYADLAGADLSYAYLRDAFLGASDLSGANLTYANLPGASAKFANLAGANLTSADLYYVDLTHTNLSHANLTRADLSNARLTDATMTGAILDGVTWSGTVCPDGTVSDSHGGTCVGPYGVNGATIP